MAVRRLIRGVGLAASAALAAATPPAAASELAPGSCGWPLRSDPVLVNVLYPDDDAVYYGAYLPAPPPGASYRIRGEFPHARYMSFVSYNGLPMDALLDADIPPDPGSSNPFVPGGDRTAERRSYTVTLVPEPAPAQPSRREPGALYVGGGQLSTPAPAFSVLYRVYLPDRDAGPVGGVRPPTIELVGPGEGRLDLDALPCEEARDALASTPLHELHRQFAAASAPVELPALTAPDPPEWLVESGLTAGLLGRGGQGDVVSGGPASNPHNRYLAATVSRAHGQVLAIRGRAATTPATVEGEPTMGSGDLRYWSFCQNSRTTRYVDCLSDAEVQLDEDGWYTIAVSAPADRPAGARNWLPFGPEPEGRLLYRHMLPSPEFMPRSAHGAEAPLAESMGEYYPRAAYCSAARFEIDACGLDP